MENKVQSFDIRLIEPLTPRERDVLRLLAQHLRYQDIAGQLVIALTSVKWYAQQIYGKLGVDNRRDAIQKAQTLGILDFEPPAASPLTAKTKHNLPRQLTRFIGREGEIGRVIELVRQTPLVTLTGSGGVGKTRLAQVVAGELVMDFQHGAWLVELAPLTDEKLVPQSVAAIFGLIEQPSSSLMDILISYLREKQILLVIDNCEHLIGGCAQLVAHLLKSCSRLSVLATSREGLGIAGEVIYRVPSLSLPKARTYPDPQDLLNSEAINLFLDRAGQSRSGFQLTPENAAAVMQICRRVDGIPLAIELASARVGVLGVEQIAARLENAFHLLTGGSRTALPRYQTIQASIDWSYDHLSASEQTLLNRLSVFAGGWTLEAAERVCGFDELAAEQVLNLLLSLINKSLVVVDAGENEARYSLLETIRQYAQEKLGEKNRESLTGRHLDYFCWFAEQVEPHLRGKDQVRWMDRVGQDLDNIRASLNWALREGSLNGLGLASALRWFWYIRVNRSEFLQWFTRLLESSPSRENTIGEQADFSYRMLLAKGFYVGGSLANAPFQSWQGMTWLKEARSRYQELGTAGELGSALCGVNLFPPDPDECLQLLTESMKIVEVKGDQFDLSEVFSSLGMVWLYEKGKPLEALIYLENSLAIRRELGDIEGIGWDNILMGDLNVKRGNYFAAAENYQESLASFQKTGAIYNQSSALDRICSLYILQGKSGEAAQVIEQETELGEALGDKGILISSFFNRARMAYSLNDFKAMEMYCNQIILLCIETGEKIALYRAKGLLAIIDWILGKDAEASKLINEVIGIWQNSNGPVTDEYFFVVILPDVASRLVERRQYYLGVKAFGLAMQSESWPVEDLLPVEKARYDRAMSIARSALGEADFLKAWTEGANLDALETLKRILDHMTG